MDYFHQYAFNVPRQLGANFEMLGSYLRWLSEFAIPGANEKGLGGNTRGLGELLATGNLHRPWFNWMIPYRLKRPSA